MILTRKNDRIIANKKKNENTRESFKESMHKILLIFFSPPDKKDDREL